MPMPMRPGIPPSSSPACRRRPPVGPVAAAAAAWRDCGVHSGTGSGQLLLEAAQPMAGRAPAAGRDARWHSSRGGGRAATASKRQQAWQRVRRMAAGWCDASQISKILGPTLELPARSPQSERGTSHLVRHTDLPLRAGRTWLSASLQCVASVVLVQRKFRRHSPTKQARQASARASRWRAAEERSNIRAMIETMGGWTTKRTGMRAGKRGLGLGERRRS